MTRYRSGKIFKEMDEKSMVLSRKSGSLHLRKVLIVLVTDVSCSHYGSRVSTKEVSHKTRSVESCSVECPAGNKPFQLLEATNCVLLFGERLRKFVISGSARWKFLAVSSLSSAPWTPSAVCSVKSNRSLAPYDLCRFKAIGDHCLAESHSSVLSWLL